MACRDVLLFEDYSPAASKTSDLLVQFFRNPPHEIEKFVWYGFMDHIPIGVANLLLEPMGVVPAAPA